MPSINQKGFSPIIITLLLAMSLIIGLVLVKSPQIFKPKAQDSGGGNDLIQPKIGASYSHTSFGDCTKPNSMDGTSLIQTYHKPGVRENAKLQMKQMHDNGIQTIRLTVWFQHDAKNFINGTLSSKNSKVENWGPTDPDQPNEPQRDNLVNLMTDIKEIGFTRVTLSPGPGWKNTPRDDSKGEYGVYPNGPGLYDPNLLTEDWLFIKDLVDIMKQSGPKDFVMDIAMLEPVSDERVRQNSLQYVKQIYTNYINTYGYDGSSLTASVGFFNADPMAVQTNLQYSIDTLKSTGLPIPKYYSFELYANKDQTQNALVTINNVLKQNGLSDAKIRLLETYYDDPQQAEAIKDFIAQNPGMIEEIVPWPITRYGLEVLQCYGFDVNPPYSAMNMMNILNLSVPNPQTTAHRGTINAQPTSCTLNSNGICTSMISWDTSNIYRNNANISIKVRETGAYLLPKSDQIRGSIDANWISENGFHFDLYINDSIFDSVFVSGTKTTQPPPNPETDTITATPSVCTVNAQGLCKTKIKWNIKTKNVKSAIKIRETGSFFLPAGDNNSGELDAPWITESGYNFDLYINDQLTQTLYVKGQKN